MPPKEQVNKTSPFDQNPYKHGDDVLLISNFKQPNKAYFPHASGTELSTFLLSAMEESISNAPSNPSDVTLVAPLPGRMYFTNNTLTGGDNPTIKFSPSHKLAESGTSSTSSTNLTNLDDEIDINAYDDIIRWINEQSQFIVRAANDFITKYPNVDVKIMIPCLKREDGHTTLTQTDLFAANHVSLSSGSSSSKKITITIDFTRQWTDIFTTEEKIAELAYNLAYYKKGQEVFNKNPTQHNVADLYKKSAALAEHHIDLSELPTVTEDYIKLLCEYHKVPYEDYEDAQGQIQIGVKSSLAAEERKFIDDNKAKLIFVDYCLLSFLSFSGSKNGLAAKAKNFAGKTALPNESFFKGNICFYHQEMPLLILGSKKTNNVSPRTMYNQDPNETETLRIITHLSIILKRDPVNFYQPKPKEITKPINLPRRPSTEEACTDNVVSVGGTPPSGPWKGPLANLLTTDSDSASDHSSNGGDDTSNGDQMATVLIRNTHELIAQSFRGKTKPISVFLVLQHVHLFLEWYNLALLDIIYLEPERKIDQSSANSNVSDDIAVLRDSFLDSISTIMQALTPYITDDKNSTNKAHNDLITLCTTIAQCNNDKSSTTHTLSKVAPLLDKSTVKSYRFSTSTNSAETMNSVTKVTSTVANFRNLDESMDDDDAEARATMHRENTLLLFTTLRTCSKELADKTTNAITNKRLVK